MKLEVGKTYKLNNGEIHPCTRMNGDDPLAVYRGGFGPFVIDGCRYHMDGTFGLGKSHDLNVALCVDDTPITWLNMTPEQKEILTDCIETIDELYDNKLAQQARDAFGIKPDPKVELMDGTCWAYYYKGTEPSLVGHKASDDCTDGKWTATRVDGNLTKITWDAV